MFLCLRYSYRVPTFECPLVDRQKKRQLSGLAVLEIVVHFIPAHYPFAARGIEK
jgi:hypothetical protein